MLKSPQFKMVNQKQKLKILIFLIISLYVYSIYSLKNFYFLTEKNAYFLIKDTLDEFININKKLLSDNEEPKKVVFSKAHGEGYGNRLYNIISSLLIGVLTDSVVLIDVWSEIDKHIQIPYDGFYKTNKSSSLNSNYKPEQIYLFRARNMWAYKKKIGLLMQTSIPRNLTRFMYISTHALFMEMCTNPAYFEKIKYYELASHKTIKKALDSIKYNKTDDEKMDSLFQIGFEVGGNLLNKFWLPKKSLGDVIDYYLNKEFTNSYVIGIQLRTQYFDLKKDLDKFFNCALKLEENVKQSNKNKTVKWFISTDSEKLSNIIKKLYTTKAISANGTITHTHFHSVGQARAIIDIELLSRCDEIIMSGGSTFGYVASMKNKKLPYYIDGKSSMKKCLRTVLSAPSRTPAGSAVF